MLDAESYGSRLLSAARHSVRNWASLSEKRLLSLEGRLKTFQSSRHGSLVDVYVPIEIMLDPSNSSLVPIYAAAINSTFRVHQNNAGVTLSNSPANNFVNHSQQEEVLRAVKGLLPGLIANDYPDLRNLAGSIDLFLNVAQRQIDLYIRHDAVVRPANQERLERLQVGVQGLYATISKQKELPFDNPTNPSKLRVVPTKTYKR